MLRTTITNQESLVLRSLLEFAASGGGIMACLLVLRRLMERVIVLKCIYPTIKLRKMLRYLSLTRNRGKPNAHILPYPRSDGLYRIRGAIGKGVTM